MKCRCHLHIPGQILQLLDMQLLSGHLSLRIIICRCKSVHVTWAGKLPGPHTDTRASYATVNTCTDDMATHCVLAIVRTRAGRTLAPCVHDPTSRGHTLEFTDRIELATSCFSAAVSLSGLCFTRYKSAATDPTWGIGCTERHPRLYMSRYRRIKRSYAVASDVNSDSQFKKAIRAPSRFFINSLGIAGLPGHCSYTIRWYFSSGLLDAAYPAGVWNACSAKTGVNLSTF